MPAVSSDQKTLSVLVMRESDRLSRLLSEFLDFARVRVARTTPVDLSTIARGAAGLAAAHPDRDVSVRVTCVVPENDPVNIEGDEDLLHRAVFNLALNAVQASPPQGEVCIEVAARQPRRRTCRRPLRRRCCFAARDGFRTGHSGGNPRSHVRPVFHHQAERQRARARRRSPGHRGAPRPRARRQRHSRHALHRDPAILTGDQPGAFLDRPNESSERARRRRRNAAFSIRSTFCCATKASRRTSRTAAKQASSASPR